MVEKPSLKAIFDALSDTGSADSFDPDWCKDVLERDDPKDVKTIRQSFRQGGTDNEVATKLGIWPP